MVSPDIFFIFWNFHFLGSWGEGGGGKREKYSPKWKNNYIRHMPYLRNSIATWYTCVKWWYLQAFFSFFWYFHISGCERGKRAKNDPRWQKSCTLYLRNHISYDCHLWYICVKWRYLQVCVCVCVFFFHFLKILIYGFNSGVKEQKMGYNDKKLCLWHSISE